MKKINSETFCLASLPDESFMRLPEVLSVYPVGKTTWWNGVKSKKYPQPIKLSKRCIAWRVKDIRNLIANIK